MTTVHVKKYVDCPFSATIEFADEALRKETRMQVSPAAPIGAQVAYTTQTIQDSTDTARVHDALLLAWQPQGGKWLPHFRGVFTVRPSQRGSQLRITGAYEPPFGPLGRIFDFIVGRSIARQTLMRLLSQVAGDIERRWEADRASAKPV